MTIPEDSETGHNSMLINFMIPLQEQATPTRIYTEDTILLAKNLYV